MAWSRRPVRSGDPDGLRQEAWALLALHQALRPSPAPTPARASYQAAIDTAQDLSSAGGHDSSDERSAARMPNAEAVPPTAAATATGLWRTVALE
jgi:hypothetical protein